MKNFTKEINGYPLKFVCTETDKNLKVEVEIPPLQRAARRQMWIHTDLENMILEESKLDLVSTSNNNSVSYSQSLETSTVEFTFTKKTKSKNPHTKKNKVKAFSTSTATKKE